MRGEQFLHWILYHLGFHKAHTQTTEAERQAIRRYAAGCKSLVEIGVFEGVTARVLREAMHEDGRLVCIDPFFSGAAGICYSYSIARRETEKCQKGRLEFLRLLSHEAVHQWQGSIDFIFFDGDHSDEGVRRDWEDWSKHLAAGGIAAFHDSVAPEGTLGPPALVRDLSRNSDFNLVEQVDSLSIFKKITM